ncbi:DUF3800 domain-containing protein [Clostridium chromiireducens]|uniref:DUF3800 domain-containing protein n=1 Tax=Clostridium chromiireducens TaxID=225345 RepID=A0A1V4IK85_9CLOT|nr:DUF3800 domain-containing protein [Clostridium chromiireducens]OPJ60431.1 hypothetical protein CLCHR_29170 [Clostridium chromiireducens]
MGKKYLMFVDERGFLSKNINDNITMIGVIFEYDYCVNSKNKECELKSKLKEYKKGILSEMNCKLFLDDMVFDKNVYKNIDIIEKKRFVNHLPALLKNLKFTIISSSAKHDSNKTNDSYSLVTRRLLKKFYSFVIRKNGESGGVIMEARNERSSCIMQQNFFNVYYERNTNLSIPSNIKDKINTFIVCEKNNKTYGTGIELNNMLNNIICRVSNGIREIDRKLISYNEYGYKDKIFDSIKHKLYKEVEIGIPSNHLQSIQYNNIETFNKEVEILKEQLALKDTSIIEKDKEISSLINEIQLLSKQLGEVLINKRGENIISRIFSEIDVKINRTN